MNNTIIEGNKKTECGKTSPDHKKNKTPPKKRDLNCEKIKVKIKLKSPIFKQPYVFEEEENKVETKSSTLEEENMDGENSRMEEDEYNRRVRERWKESVRRWEEMDREDWHYGSPGRKERKEKKTKLENHWLLLRECAAFIKENTNTWETRGMKETKRIREEERKERILLAGRKKKLYDEKRGKKKKASGDVDGKLESVVEEKDEIKRKMNERLEIAEDRKTYGKNIEWMETL